MKLTGTAAKGGGSPYEVITMRQRPHGRGQPLKLRLAELKGVTPHGHVFSMTCNVPCSNPGKLDAPLRKIGVYTEMLDLRQQSDPRREATEADL